MQSNTVRTAIAFSLIALILGVGAIGGVRLMKLRSNSYAQPASVAANKQPDTTQSAPTSSPATPTPAAQNTPSQSSTSGTSSTETPVPSSLPTPSTSSTPTAQTTPRAPAPQTVPNTSGLSDVMPTFALMLLAMFFASRLMRAKANYRRYVGE